MHLWASIRVMPSQCIVITLSLYSVQLYSVYDMHESRALSAAQRTQKKKTEK